MRQSPSEILIGDELWGYEGDAHIGAIISNDSCIREEYF